MQIIYALLSAFFAGLAAIFTKIEFKGVDFNPAAAIRNAAALIISWGLNYRFSEKSAGRAGVRRKL